MAIRQLVLLGISAVIVGVGLALRSSRELGEYASLLIALGVSGASCVGVVLVVRTFRMAKAASIIGGEAEARLRVLAGELVMIAEAVERRGMLALAESSVTRHNDVYTLAAKKAVGGADPASIRSAASGAMDERTRELVRSSQKVTQTAQWVGIGALSMSLMVVTWTLVGNGFIGFSDAAALGILLLVYGSFMLTVIAQDMARRSHVQSREGLVAGAMIGETLAQVRVGAGPGVIRAELDRLLARPATDVRGDGENERVAA